MVSMFTKTAVQKILIRILLHLLFWCGVLLFFTYFFSSGTTKFYDTFAFALFLMPITMATTYVSIYKLIPDYFVTKRYAPFALYSMYTLIISCYLIVVSIFFSLIYLAGFQYEDMNPATKNILYVATSVYIIVILASAFKLLKLNAKHTTETKLLETKILETQLKLKEQELHYLKMQIHPHFLFNTLNTMYGFALKKADETPEMILKLSNLLDYLLYQSDKPFVLLPEELNHIEDYIALEKLRFNETLNITFVKEGISEDLKIAPMLLLPFVENSFKHGAIKNGKLDIFIQLMCTGKTINLVVENTHAQINLLNKGIGLENINKRLQILYPNKHKLAVENNKQTYKVVLKLNLN